MKTRERPGEAIRRQPPSSALFRADYRLEIHRTGYRANDAYSAYLEMGAPKDLSATQVTQLMDLTRDLPVTERVVRSGSDGNVKVTVPMNSNDIVLLKLQRLR